MGKKKYEIFVSLIIVLLSLLFSGCGSTDGLIELDGDGFTASRKVKPVVMLTGSNNLQFSILSLLARDYCRDNSFQNITAKIIFNGNEIALTKVEGNDWSYTLPAAPQSAGWASISLTGSDGQSIILKNVIRIIDKFRVTLTFDDGPAIDKKNKESLEISGSPTVKTLDGLDEFVHGIDNSEKGIKAAFFVLTTPDKFLFLVFDKAESANGKIVLQEVAERGHVLGVHWGGEYRKQSVGHDRRVVMPPYGEQEYCGMRLNNALECDIAECISVIRKETGLQPEFVRPPFWRYKNDHDPQIEQKVQDVYKKFGLKMILTDAKFPDGGYSLISIISVNKYMKFPRLLHNAFLSGEDNLVISMHDSNSYTANILGNILKMITDEFNRTSFAGVRAGSGQRLDFADSAVEVRSNLQQKKRYVLFPDYKAE